MKISQNFVAFSEYTNFNSAHRQSQQQIEGLALSTLQLRDNKCWQSSKKIADVGSFSAKPFNKIYTENIFSANEFFREKSLNENSWSEDKGGLISEMLSLWLKSPKKGTKSLDLSTNHPHNENLLSGSA